MNWQYDTIVSVRKNLESKGYDYDRLYSVVEKRLPTDEKYLSDELLFIRKHLKDYLDSDVYERAEEVSLYPEDSVEKLKDNPENLKQNSMISVLNGNTIQSNQLERISSQRVMTLMVFYPWKL